MPYKNLDEAIELSKMGKGSLCSSIVTADTAMAKNMSSVRQHIMAVF